MSVPDRLTEIQARARKWADSIAIGVWADGGTQQYAEDIPYLLDELAGVRAELATANERETGLTAALEAASEDARLVIQDYYSGLPEHRVPVDGAMARLAHLFERNDMDCTARTVEEIAVEGVPARAALKVDG